MGLLSSNLAIRCARFGVANQFGGNTAGGIAKADYQTTCDFTLDETADGKMVSLTGTVTDRANSPGTAPYQANNVFSQFTSHSANIALGGIKLFYSRGNVAAGGVIVVYGIKDY